MTILSEQPHPGNREGDTPARLPSLDWTVESTKLLHFSPPGLEVDDQDAADVTARNPYVEDPIERDETVPEVERPWYGEKYFLPIDKAESSRLDRQHVMWTHLLDGDLVKAPIRDPKHVLDLGTGSGIWATEFAKQHPGSEVLGIDLSVPTATDIPPNCRFQQLDFTSPASWSSYPHKFDLIHARLIFVGQQDHPALLRHAYAALAPGGYLEHQDLYGVPAGLDGTLRGRYLEGFFRSAAAASRRVGVDVLAMPRYAGWMASAGVGFEGVVETQRALPLNGSWPRGGRYRAIGAMQAENLRAGMGGMYTRVLTGGLGWSAEETAEAVERAREQVRDGSIHAYFPVFIVYGRKPDATKLQQTDYSNLAGVILLEVPLMRRVG